MTAGDLTAVAAQMTNIIQLRREDLELQREELDVLDQQRRCRSDILAFRREELALSERRKQQRAEEIAQSERYVGRDGPGGALSPAAGGERPHMPPVPRHGPGEDLPPQAVDRAAL